MKRGMVGLAALVMLGGAVEGHTRAYSGGLNPVSAGKCLWEALVCVGMSLIVLSVYRSAFDRQDQFRCGAERIAPIGHEHSPCMTARTFDENIQARRRGNCGDDSQGDPLALENRRGADVCP